jgi:hypothetical protein
MKKLLLTLLFSCTTAHAEFVSGNTLYANLRGTVGEQMYALGYIIGVTDRSMSIDVCLPGGVVQGQIQDVVTQFMASNPQMRNYSADLSVVLALREVWPCKERRKS